MRYRVVVATVVVLASYQAPVFVGGVDQSLPLKDGRPIVASINDESISLDEFLMERDPADDKAQALQGYGNAKDFELLERLVNIRLIVQEAATMGIAEQPDIQKQVEVTARAILRDVLLERFVKDVTADPAKVEEMFRELAQEWKTASVLFQDETLATRAREEIAAGQTFADVAGRAVKAKSAQADTDDAYHQQKDYLPPIAEAIVKLKVGDISPVIHIPSGFVITTVTDIRYPDSAEVRTEARKRVLSAAQNAVIQEHDKTLRHDYLTIDKAVLDGLDYEADTPGVAALRTDKRVIAEIKDADPVTVGDLTESLRMQSFHGTEDAAQRKRMNELKASALEATLGRRLLNVEALKLGLDKTPEYLDRVRSYEDSLVFGAFVQKVIVPDSKMTEDEVRRYYDEHLTEFSSPEMLKIRGLAFTGHGPAEAAMRKLQEGADYGWLVANADGQADKATPGLLTFDGRPLTIDGMPDDVQKAVLGAKAGEFRLYGSSQGPVYVLAIQEAIAPEAKPYADVRDAIAKKLYGQKLTKNVDAYLAKLRDASTIAVHLRKAQ